MTRARSASGSPRKSRFRRFLPRRGRGATPPPLRPARRRPDRRAAAGDADQRVLPVAAVADQPREAPVPGRDHHRLQGRRAGAGRLDDNRGDGGRLHRVRRGCAEPVFPRLPRREVLVGEASGRFNAMEQRGSWMPRRYPVPVGVGDFIVHPRERTPGGPLHQGSGLPAQSEPPVFALRGRRSPQRSTGSGYRTLASSPTSSRSGAAPSAGNAIWCGIASSSAPSATRTTRRTGTSEIPLAKTPGTGSKWNVTW